MPRPTIQPASFWPHLLRMGMGMMCDHQGTVMCDHQGVYFKSSATTTETDDEYKPHPKKIRNSGTRAPDPPGEQHGIGVGRVGCGDCGLLAA